MLVGHYSLPFKRVMLLAECGKAKKQWIGLPSSENQPVSADFYYQTSAATDSISISLRERSVNASDIT
ncbi:hypothetical protein VNO78_02667 [Psophocarpus tetragonolobus]|uniref:Uncharacterized protein n=1 Tax=Psophocarpus tetragonolobus TaxID=3891 RepID=A0AAN9T1P3_PSOTE